MPDRIAKINKLIKQQVAEIIAQELSLKPGVFITVSKVDTSRDIRYTRIFISIFPEKEIDYALKTLRKEVYFIQGKLNKKLFLKIVPRIEFSIDATESNADNIEKILNDIKKG